jgi:K+-sensing histidine kinase KdpD
VTRVDVQLALVEPDLRGDPMSPLRWTTKSTRKLADELHRQGWQISADTVAAVLRAEGFSLQAKELSAVFDRFHRLDDARSTADTGLGPPIAAEIVRAHGGRSWVTSAPGQGSRFSFALRRTHPQR